MKYIVLMVLIVNVFGCGGGAGESAASQPVITPITDPVSESPVVTPPTTPSTPDNVAPTGSIVISGELIEGQTLTINNTLEDSNGLGAFTYQWFKGNTEIEGSTQNSITLSSNEIDFTISVQVSYVDGDGYNESIMSQATEQVSAIGVGEPPVSKPNIILIISDDQGVDASNQYSYSTDLPKTPILDSLATSGVVFDNAWATPACTTTRGTIMTGMHGVNSGVSFVPAVMDTSLTTLPRFLAENDASKAYSMAVFGKWHLGGGDLDLSHPNSAGVAHYVGNITGTLNDYSDWTLTDNGSQTQVTQYHTSKVTDLAMDWITQQTSPWFVWLAYVAPHSPFHLPPNELHTRSELSGSAEDIAQNPRPYYLAAIEAMDTEIGRLLASLPTEERENTLVIFIGDNGTPAPVIDTSVYTRQHSKNSLYEGGIRVPLLVSGNLLNKQNTRESRLVNSTDLYATIAQIAGGDITQVYNSHSFYDTLFDVVPNPPVRQYNYAEFQRNGVAGWAVCNQHYKLLSIDSQQQALFDMNVDINEQNDLLQSGDDWSALVLELAEYGQSIRSGSD